MHLKRHPSGILASLAGEKRFGKSRNKSRNTTMKQGKFV